MPLRGMQSKEQDEHEEEEVRERVAVAIESGDRLLYLDAGGQRRDRAGGQSVTSKKKGIKKGNACNRS
jgi:hypothetical protein